MGAGKDHRLSLAGVRGALFSHDLYLLVQAHARPEVLAEIRIWALATVYSPSLAWARPFPSRKPTNSSATACAAMRRLSISAASVEAALSNRTASKSSVAAWTARSP